MKQNEITRVATESNLIGDKLRLIGCQFQRISFYWWKIALPNGTRLQLQFDKGSWILKPRGSSKEFPQIQKAILLAVANRFSRKK